MKRIIKLTILFCAVLILSIGCRNIKLTTVPTEISNPYPTGSIETSYPSSAGNETSSNPSAIQTAYPSTSAIFTPVPIGVIPAAPPDAPEPDPGKASISGVLYSYTIKQAVPGTGFYLLPAVGTDKNQVPPIIVSPEATKGDIISQSDNTGIISIKDIPPGNYFLVVWAPLNWSVAQKSESDTSPLLLELNSGSQNPLGVIYISWP